MNGGSCLGDNCFFLFQAEGGIRDIGVTGVETCALPISCWRRPTPGLPTITGSMTATRRTMPDRKSTRLNSRHANTSYAVFCLKKKNHIRRRVLHQNPKETIQTKISQ